jgi:hypothetical protein
MRFESRLNNYLSQGDTQDGDVLGFVIEIPEPSRVVQSMGGAVHPRVAALLAQGCEHAPDPGLLAPPWLG